MNMSQVVNYLKTMYGINQITLPFKDEVTGQPVPTENVIRNVLINMTIPTFSQFAPWLRTGIYDLNKMECLDPEVGLWRLPEELTITPVLYIHHISYPFRNKRTQYGFYSPTYPMSWAAQGVATSMSYQMLASQLRAEPTWKYAGADQVYLYGYPRIKLEFSVACQHLPNGESLDQGYYDSFTELASLDMKVFMYNTLKYYDGLPSAHGQINLGIADWSSAEADRTAWLEKARDTFHLDMGWEQFM